MLSEQKKNADVLLNAFKDIGLAVNTGKTKCMEVGRHRGMMANEPHVLFSSHLYVIKKFKLFTNQLHGLWNP